MRVALMGFLPWVDAERGVDVRENPSALAAKACAERIGATFVPIAVSGQGIEEALATVRSLDADLVVAVGQTKTGPRVERFGRVPGVWAPAKDGEARPWELAPDAVELAERLNALNDPDSMTEPFVASDDAGGYFCDHLCVELVRQSRRRPIRARFLHVTSIDGCEPNVRAARLNQYAKQIQAAVKWLERG